MDRRLLGIALSVTCGWVAGAGADTVEDLLLPLLGLHGRSSTAALTNPWLRTPAAGVVASLRNEDLLRRYVDDTKVTDLSARRARVTAILALPGPARHWLQIGTGSGDSDRIATGQDRDWTGSLGSSGALGTIAYRRDGASHRLAVGVGWAREQRGRQSLVVQSFHRSASDSRMNRYLWDLLEPTLGDELDYSVDQQSLRADIGWSAVLAHRTRVGLQASWQRSTPNASIDHVNDGDRRELRGPRQTDIDQDTSVRRLLVGLERRLASTDVRLAAGFTSREASSLAQQRDVPRSDSGILLDIVELARARADQRGPDVALQATWEPAADAWIYTAATWAHSTVAASGAGNTPVLGYRLRTLPISHGGTFELSGRHTTWAVDSGMQVRRQRFGWQLHGMALRWRYRGHTAADAQMQFGLVVTPVDQATAYRLHLYRLSVAPWLRLSATTELEYEITQYAGSLRGDRRAGTDALRPRSTHRGGRIHTLSIRYHL